VFSLIDAITSFCTLVHVGVLEDTSERPDVAQIANAFHPPEEHRGAARIGRAKIAFFERDDVHSSPLLKHENAFYRVKKGDLF
jgi:hypothetical protein